MSRIHFSNNQIWCPKCKEYVSILKIIEAAELANVSRRSIYRYIEDGSIYAVRIAGKTYRVCSSCLVKQYRQI